MQLMISDIGISQAACCVLVPVSILVFVSFPTHAMETVAYKITIDLAIYPLKPVLQWNGLFYCLLYFAAASGLKLSN